MAVAEGKLRFAAWRWGESGTMLITFGVVVVWPCDTRGTSCRLVVRSFMKVVFVALAFAVVLRPGTI